MSIGLRAYYSGPDGTVPMPVVHPQNAYWENRRNEERMASRQEIADWIEAWLLIEEVMES